LFCHSREGGNPDNLLFLLDSRLRGNDKKGLISRKSGVFGQALSRYKSLIDHFLNFINDELPKLKMASQLKKIHFLTMLEDLSDFPKSRRTLNAIIQQLKALFKFAVKEEYIEKNPAESIERYRETGRRGHVKYWDEDEIESIFEEVKPQWRDGLEFIYNTGLRKNELIYLTWDDVNTNGVVPTIEIQAKEGWDPKSAARIVTLNKCATFLISKQSPSKKHDWVFKGPGGGQIHRDKIYRELKRAANKLGLEGNVHKLRHSFASNLLSKGAGIEKVSKLLGHTKLETTMIYGYLRPTDLKKTVELLD
ncbi:MAG: tyrosine-type recombinase/integrase, partial [Candidatus Hatepunaea meridiana]|nr:tyrosine-type recombinase/integrase [Candidatus Hatepunaea meridiana]